MRLGPRVEAIIMFAAVVAAAALAAFVRSVATGEPFSLNWGVTLIIAAAFAAIFYLGPPLMKRISSAMRKKDE